MKPKDLKKPIGKRSIFAIRLKISLSVFMIILSSITIILSPSVRANNIATVPSPLYSTIQSALDDSLVDIIEVLPGTYAESLDIYRSVTLLGLYGPDETILDVPGGTIGMRIRANDVYTTGFKIEGGTTGIYAAPDPLKDPLFGIILKELKIVSCTGDGIVFEKSSGTIEDCLIQGNSDNGLEVLDSSGLTVFDCIFSENTGNAIDLLQSQEISFTANLIQDQTLAWRLESCSNIVSSQNLVEGGAGVHLIGSSSNLFEENIMELDSFGFKLEHGILDTLSNHIKGNLLEKVSGSDVAVDLVQTEGNFVNQNIIFGGWDIGLMLDQVAVGEFEGNVISGPATGVVINQGDFLVFEGNVIIDGSSYGIQINEADNVEVTGNVIVGCNLGVSCIGEVLNLLVDGNVFSENDVAVKVEGPAHTASVNHNVVDSNVFGIDFENTYEGTITYNIVTENTDAGIQLVECDNILVAHNEVVVGGLAGIRILDSGSSPETLVVEWNNVLTEDPQPSFDPGGVPIGIDYRMYGIEARRSTLAIQDNLIEDIVHESWLAGCDSGYGMYIKACGDVDILRNTVDGYQRYGILIEEPSFYPLPLGEEQNIPIFNNIVLGLGTDYNYAQSGIIVQKGANASLEYNIVKYNWYENTDDQAIGIGVLDAPYAVEVMHNTVIDNQYGIYLEGIENSNIFQNLAQGNVRGIMVEDAGKVLIMSNDVIGPIINPYSKDLFSVGIFVINSPFVEVVSNTVDDHCTGIKTQASPSVHVHVNDVTNSENAGIQVSGGQYVLIEENYVAFGENGILVDEGALFTEVTNNLVEGNARGIIVISSFVTEIIDNEIWDGSIVGILLEYDPASYVYRNTVTNHGTGIKSIESFTVYIDKNDVTENVEDGIYLESSTRGGVVKRNELQGNGIGLHVTGGNNDFVASHNNIEGNDIGVKIESIRSYISIEFNQITRNINEGVLMSPTASWNTVFRNIIKFNGGTGIKVEGNGNIVRRNTINNNNNYGIWVTGNYNIFKRNVVKSNKPYDIRDDGIGNIWD